jgi:[ribosomal protein S5]-alanine N-acetyltransferase
MALTLVAIGRDGVCSDPGSELGRDLALEPGTAAAVCLATAEMYRTTGFTPPWVGYLGVLAGKVVGTCAFKAAPSDGAVEIAFFTFPGHEGRGVATSMVRQLIDIAYASDRSLRIIAHTPPERSASNAILRKVGFLLLGDWEDPVDGTVWEWEYIR